MYLVPVLQRSLKGVTPDCQDDTLLYMLPFSQQSTCFEAWKSMKQQFDL